MAKDRFLIAPIKEGLRTDLKPWILPESAFAKLENAYLFKGRIRKRFGTTYTGTGGTVLTNQLFSRLRITLPGGAAVGCTDGAGAATGTVPGTIRKIGQMFSIGTEIFTVNALGVPSHMLTTGTSTTHTYNTTTGAYVFAGATPATQIYFYSAEPVMGLFHYETDILNDQPAIAFDTQFAYQYAGGFWDMVGPTVGSPFKGTNANFFNTANWRGATGNVHLLFVTNFNASIPVAATDDPMWYFNGTALTGWTTFQPVFIVGANFVRTGRIIIPFKNRLLLLNTIENDGGGAGGTNTKFVNRCRFSHNGSPIAASAFYEPNQVGSTGGGYIDTPTKEEILGAGFIKDRLIVYFESSTWEIAYTGNNVQPFIWQKINTELGTQSTQSAVPFDKGILNVGTTGIHACNGINVERIDDVICDTIFTIRKDNSGPLRVCGIRDYYTEMVFWSFPVSNAYKYAFVYPNQIFAYNYSLNSWAIFDDSITAFGYFEQQTGTTWASTTLTWNTATFEWDAGTLQSKYKQIIGGNQQGYIFNVLPDVSSNASVLQITNIALAAGSTSVVEVDIIDHNLDWGDYIKITNCQGVTGVNDKIYSVAPVSNTQILIVEDDFAGVYLGGGTASRISQIDIMTKKYNPYTESGRNLTIESVDFAIQKTFEGEITVDYFPSSAHLSMVQEATATDSILGTNILETHAYPIDLVPLEQTQDLLWHRVYFATDGDGIQLRLYLSDEQMTNVSMAESDFQLEGFILNVSPTGRIS